MAVKTNLIIDQGATFFINLDISDTSDTPVDLTGYTATSQMRKTYTSSSATAFTASINTTSSSVVLEMTATQTANLASGRYVYDVELRSGNTVSRIGEGIVTVTPQVTR